MLCILYTIIYIYMCVCVYVCVCAYISNMAYYHSYLPIQTGRPSAGHRACLNSWSLAAQWWLLGSHFGQRPQWPNGWVQKLLCQRHPVKIEEGSSGDGSIFRIFSVCMLPFHCLSDLILEETITGCNQHEDWNIKKS